MKPSAHFCIPALACIAAALLFAAPASAQQVRVTLLMLSMPEEKFLALRPDLLDSKKLEKAIPGLLDSAKRKEITLEGFLMVVTKNGQRGVMETDHEIYDAYLPRVPYHMAPGVDPGFTPVTPTTPAGFETRNPGETLEVEPVVAQDGVHIDLNIAPQHVEVLGYSPFTLPKDKDIAGANGKDVRQPDYFTMKTTTSLCLLSCHHALLGVFKKAKPEGAVEIFIVGAEVLDVSG